MPTKYQVTRGEEVLKEFTDVFEAYKYASEVEKREKAGDFPHKNSKLIIKIIN